MRSDGFVLTRPLFGGYELRVRFQLNTGEKLKASVGLTPELLMEIRNSFVEEGPPESVVGIDLEGDDAGQD